MRVTYKAIIDATIYVKKYDKVKAILTGDDLADFRNVLNHLEHVEETARELGACELRFTVEPVDNVDNALREAV